MQYTVERSGEIVRVNIALAAPSLNVLISRLAPLLVALIFWLIGLGVKTFTPSDRASGVFFMWCQVSALMLIAGAASSQGSPWTSSLFNLLLLVIGPLSVHFHLRFPQTTKPWREQVTLITIYGLAFIAWMPYLLWGPINIRAFTWFPLFVSAGRLFLAVNLLVVVGLLFYAYRHATTSGVRGKIRIVVLGGVLSAVPLVTLTILPQALLQQPIVPFQYAFLLLGILPTTYGYAIFRHRLIEIEKHVNRGATFILVYSILGGFYLLLYWFLHRWLFVTLDLEPFLNTVLVLFLASIFVPLHRRIQRLVDTVFYGGWYDYRSAVTHITQGLEQINDLRLLAETLGERLVSILHLEDACIFLRDFEGVFSVIQVVPSSALDIDHPLSFSALPRSSLNYLLRIGDVERSSLSQALSEVELSPEEHQLLDSEQIYLWVPIIVHGQLQGLLALGPKFGGDVFSAEDLDILRVVARQTGPVIENIHLLTRLRQHAAELEVRVTERTAELHDAKERVEAILASVGDGVVVTELDGSIVTVNTAFEKQSGSTELELIGQKIYEMFSESNNTAVLEDMKSMLSRGRVWTGELVAHRQDGASYDVQLTFAPVRNQDGRMVSYVGSQRDITRQKELDRLKDQFVSDVSHELRTPTTNINLFLELLEDAPPEKRSEYLAIVRDQSLLVRKLVEDILDLSRLTMGKAKRIEFSAIDLNALAQQIVNAHRPAADAAGLRLTFEPGSDLPPVKGERNQLARVITNLISNSVRYTFEGEVRVCTQRVNGRVGLSVQDTGIGISPDDRNHLFERFYRGQQVRQSKIHGTGLGLAIVKEIVDLHEGEIEISSELGKGSTFNVWLPVQRD